MKRLALAVALALAVVPSLAFAQPGPNAKLKALAKYLNADGTFIGVPLKCNRPVDATANAGEALVLCDENNQARLSIDEGAPGPLASEGTGNTTQFVQGPESSTQGNIPLFASNTGNAVGSSIVSQTIDEEGTTIVQINGPVQVEELRTSSRATTNNQNFTVTKNAGNATCSKCPSGMACVLYNQNGSYTVCDGTTALGALQGFTTWAAPRDLPISSNAEDAGTSPVSNACKCHRFHLDEAISDLDKVVLSYGSACSDDTLEIGVYSDSGATQYFEAAAGVCSVGSDDLDNDTAAPAVMGAGYYALCYSVDDGANDTIDYDIRTSSSGTQWVGEYTTTCAGGEMPATFSITWTYGLNTPVAFQLVDSE